LAAVGLVGRRESQTLGTFLSSYIDERSDVKPGTATVYGHTRRNLIGCFGEAKPLREITPGDADSWRLSLVKQGLSDNTVRRGCGIAKQFFKVAKKRGLVTSNPFLELTSTVQGNAKRFYFVTREEAARVLAACPGHPVAVDLRSEPLRGPPMPL